MKRKDYSDIENILEEKANRLESSVKYSGAIRDSKSEKRAEKERKERRGYDFPYRQIVAAVLAMVIVGAGTFGTLKFLERIGAQRLEQQGSYGAQEGSQEANDNAASDDVLNKIEPVEYDDPGDEYGGKAVYVTSGDKVYYPFVCSESLMAVINYVTPVFDYSGRLNIVNNVKDRDWTVLNVNISFPGIESYDRTFDGMSLDQICAFIDGHVTERYYVYLKVTWDDPNDENAVIYYVDFAIRRTAVSDKFEDVIKFDIDYNSGAPVDNNLLSRISGAIPAFSSAERVKCETAEALGYSIYTYDAAPAEFSSVHLAACIIDEYGDLLFDFPLNTELWYAAKTPGGHPTFFYVKRHALTSNGWTYADLYAYDTVTKEETLVISVGPKGLHSRSNLRVFGNISYDEETKELMISFYDYYTNVWNPDDKATWPDPFASVPIKWNGEKYVVEGIEGSRLSEEFASAAKTEEEIKKEQLKAEAEDKAAGRMYVTSGDMIEYPALTRAAVYEDNKLYELYYNVDTTLIEYAEPLKVHNKIRKGWNIEISVSKSEYVFYDTESFVEYLNALYAVITEDLYTYVEMNITWGNEEDSYTYGFTLYMKADKNNYNSGNTSSVEKPSGNEDFVLLFDGKETVAPVKYYEWEIEENERVRQHYYNIDDVPVLDISSAAGSVAYAYDTDKLTLMDTVISRFNWDSAMSVGANVDITWALREHTTENTYSTSLIYVEAEFQKNDGSGKYVSYVYAVSSGKPGCFPYSNNGDGLADLKVSDGKNVYAPKGERIKRYGGIDNLNHHMFNSVTHAYYKVPELTLENGLTFTMNRGYYIDSAVAFPDVELAEREEYSDVSGTHIDTWLSNLPWNEYYVGIILRGDTPEYNAISGTYRIAYVIKISKGVTSNTSEIDHSAQVAELDGWLSQRMWYGMTVDDLVTRVGSLSDNGLSFKTRFLAGDYSQCNVEDGYSFVAYRSDHYDVIFTSSHDGPPHVLLEARVIMREGAEFELPFGITLDMSPAEALNALGYTQEQITAMDGYACSGAYELRYNDRFLTLTYHCNGAVVGIELGSEPQMYMETAE